MQVSRVDGDLQGVGCACVRGRGCMNKSGVASQSSGGITALAIVVAR